jgi:hypothetical protein
MDAEALSNSEIRTPNSELRTLNSDLIHNQLLMIKACLHTQAYSIDGDMEATAEGSITITITITITIRKG